MNRYFDRNGLAMDDEIMQKIIYAVRIGIPHLEYNRAYQLKQIVELVYPNWWNLQDRYKMRSAGLTFRRLVDDDEFPELVLRDRNKNPKKYIRIQ